MSLELYSGAYIVNSADNSPVVVLQQSNPETAITKILQQYFSDLSFPEIFPNFGNINIGNSHPFATLLMNELLKGDVDASSLFPAITVNDSDDNQDEMEIGGAYIEFELTHTEYIQIKDMVNSGEAFCSQTGLDRLDTHFASNSTAGAYKRIIRSKSNIDFNIWSPNKEVTSFLYDAVKQCVSLYTKDLHDVGVDFLGGMHGRRSGDYNMDFGIILYGANLSIPVHLEIMSNYVDVKLAIVDSIVVNPDYHVLGDEEDG